ncbi:MAG: T9SS type A sorting domain-containing protein [Flavobacteriales bacterium]|nr:T9SS type A sorting domain-containing protein [Flavobacteriales bacterium]
MKTGRSSVSHEFAGEHSPSADLQAYPKPSRGHLHSILPEGALTLTLHNPNGQRVMERGLNGDATFEADVSRLAQGIYHLTVTDRSGHMHRKKIAVL